MQENKCKKSLFDSTSIVAFIGFGAYLAWTICRIIPTLLPTPLPATIDFFRNFDIFHSVAYIVILFLFGFLILPQQGKKAKKIFSILFSFLLAGGTALQYMSGWGTIINIPLLKISVIVIAFEMGFCLLWGEIFSSFSIVRCCIYIAAAYASAFLICMTIIHLSPISYLIIHASLPLVSGSLLLVLQEEKLPPIEKVQTLSTLKDIPRVFSKLPIRFFIGFALLAFLQLLISDLSEHETSYTTEFQSLCGGFIGSSIVFLGILFFPRKLDFGIIYRFFAPAIIFCLMLVLVAKPDTPPYEIFSIAICWSMFRIVTWVMWCFLAKKSQISPLIIFSIGQIALTVGEIAEKSIKPTILALSKPILTLLPFIVILALFTSSVVLNERHILTIFSKNETIKHFLPQRDHTDQHIRAIAFRYHLSRREQEIVKLILQNKSNTDIKNELVIAPSTLKTHLRNIYSKCNVHTKRDLIEVFLFDDELSNSSDKSKFE